MGTVWLSDLDVVIRNAGLPLELWDGWQTRSRSSGGFIDVRGIVVHHTASPSSTSWMSDWSFCAVGHNDAPVANMLLGRQGQVGVHAAGASNHAGSGGPWNSSRGQVPVDSGNSYLIGIEAANDGIGESWQPVMVANYLTLVGALCDAYGLDPLRDVPAHFEWAPSRKIDPFGGNVPTPGYPFTGPRSWDMGAFRAAVPSSEGEDEMANPIIQVIAPQVDGHPEMNKWFVRFASGHLAWATNADTTLAGSMGVPTSSVKMGAEQYNNLCKQAGV